MRCKIDLTCLDAICIGWDALRVVPFSFASKNLMGLIYFKRLARNSSFQRQSKLESRWIGNFALHCIRHVNYILIFQ